MRHFSGEFSGFRPLMLEELDVIAGGDGDDTDDVPTPIEPEEIVVNGIRQDTAGRSEQLMEREWLTNISFQGSWVNAEYINNEWVIWEADNPTDDQEAFKDNYDKVNAALWGNLSVSQQSGLASSLTDKGINLATDNIDIGRAYLNYESLLSDGVIQGNTSNDFAEWVSQGGR